MEQTNDELKDYIKAKKAEIERTEAEQAQLRNTFK